MASRRYRSSSAKRPKPGMSGRTWANGRSAYAVKPEKEKGPSRAQQAAADALTSILGMFESGDDLPEAVATVMIARLEGLAPMASWSLGNQLLALRAGTTDARGYRQWQGVGRHVAKGCRAFYILGPRTRKLTGEGCDDGRGFLAVDRYRLRRHPGFSV